MNQHGMNSQILSFYIYTTEGMVTSRLHAGMPVGTRLIVNLYDSYCINLNEVSER